MKKYLAFLLALCLLFGLAACGSKTNSASPSDTVILPSASLEPIDEPTPEPAPAYEDAAAVLNAAWDSIDQDQRFSVIGGDLEHAVETGAGSFSLSDGAVVDQYLGLPEDMLAKVDDAASLMHMMNANTFTGAAFHPVDAGDVQTLADALKEHIMQRQWMCGFPDKLIILSVGGYVVSCFGNEEIINNFLAAFSALDGAQVLCDEFIP